MAHMRSFFLEVESTIKSSFFPMSGLPGCSRPAPLLMLLIDIGVAGAGGKHKFPGGSLSQLVRASIKRRLD